ncbi:hypothetical protein BY458DRAFT_589978 [Sporodiniella umbellata]|nr:hypothetical protein BY458DRAFT_589978 [Sporodiniella umbellata]
MMTKYITLLFLGLLFTVNFVSAQQAVPHVDITAEFPSNPFGLIVNGQRNQVALDIKNKDKTIHTIVAVSGQVTQAEDDLSVVRNLTTTRQRHLLLAEASQQIAYNFYSEFAPGEYGLTVFVDFLVEDVITRVIGYKGKITITEPEASWFDIELLFLYAVLISGAAGVGYLIREAFFGTTKKVKKTKTEEPAERPTHRDEKGEMVLDQSWIPDHHPGANKQAKAKKRTNSRK